MTSRYMFYFRASQDEKDLFINIKKNTAKLNQVFYKW